MFRGKRQRTGWDSIPAPSVDAHGKPVVDKNIPVQASIEVEYREVPPPNMRPGWVYTLQVWNGTVSKYKQGGGYSTKEAAKASAESEAVGLADEVRKIISDRQAAETYRITV
jgi:hypothetical protein